MAVVHDNDPYLLHYRRQTTAEAARLNTQHDLIKHAILQGQLIHQSIPLAHIKHAVADLGCGTGIWLEDAAKLLSANSPALDGPVPWLVGFDTTIHPSQRDPSSRVQLVEHDCSTAFEDQYLGKFDLVNIRGLAYAVPKEKFSLLIQNANRLLSENITPSQCIPTKMLQGQVATFSGPKPKLGFGNHILRTQISLWL